MKRPELLPDWRRIVRDAWSIRWMAAAFTFTALEIVLPAFSEHFPPRVFAVMAGLASAAAFVTRILAQPEKPK